MLSILNRTTSIFTLFFLLVLFPRASFAVDYFGYFAIVNESQDLQSEVSNHENVVWIHNSSNLSQMTNSINNATQNGKKVIVSLTTLFQKGNGDFNPNWSNNWSSWVNALSPYSNDIIALYPMDEPSSDRVSVANATTMVNAIRSAFPSIPVATIYGQSANSSNQHLFDWIGIDCYSNGLFKCSGKDYTQAYSTMRQIMTPNQRIVIVPQVSLPTNKDGCCINDLKKEAKRFHAMAYGDPKVIGIFPFMWQNIPGWYGLKRYSGLKPIWQEIGLNTNSNWSFPSGVAPVYRFWSSKNNVGHFFTLSAPEGINAAVANKFTFEGIGFSVYKNQQSGMAPIYRCRDSNSHFISRDANCESHIREGVYGYVRTSQVSGTTPLYRFANTSNGTHLITTDYSEGVNNNLLYEATLGYVPAISMPSASY